MRIICLIASIVLAAVVGWHFPTWFGPIGIVLTVPLGLACGYVGAAVGDYMERHYWRAGPRIR